MDVSELLRPLEELEGGAETVARRMLVAAGSQFRDRAKELAPEGDEVTGGYSRKPDKTGSQTPGTLKRAVYLAYRDKESRNGVYTYMVSWNSNTAFWGKFAEFGYKQHFPVYFNGKMGGFVTMSGQFVQNGKNKNGTNRWKLAEGGLTPVFRDTARKFEGSAFLGTAFDQTLPLMQQIAVAEGRIAFNELIQKVKR